MESNLATSKMFSSLVDSVESELGITLQGFECQTSIGEVSHQFSHIHHKYVVFSCKYSEADILERTTQGKRATKWISQGELAGAALSTAMRKVFATFEKYRNGTIQQKIVKGQKRKKGAVHDGRKQMVLESFFKSKN